MLPPAEREIFEVVLLSAHAQADEDDDEKIEEENAGYRSTELPVHALFGDRISTARKVDRALRRAMLNNSGLASRVSH